MRRKKSVSSKQQRQQSDLKSEQQSTQLVTDSNFVKEGFPMSSDVDATGEREIVRRLKLCDDVRSRKSWTLGVGGGRLTKRKDCLVFGELCPAIESYSATSGAKLTTQAAGVARGGLKSLLLGEECIAANCPA